MNPHIKNLLFLPVLIASLGLLLPGRATAQTFTNLHSFTALSGPFPPTNSDGANLVGGLILSGNTLYGTAQAGGGSGVGTAGNGTVFSLSLGSASQLTIFPSGTNVVLTWPTNATGFILECATNLVSPTVWNTNLPAPVSFSGHFAVTNSISGAQMFYRLSL